MMIDGLSLLVQAGCAICCVAAGSVVGRGQRTDHRALHGRDAGGSALNLDVGCVENTTVTVPVHPEFAESLRVARVAGIIGAEIFTGKMVNGRVLPMTKKA